MDGSSSGIDEKRLPVFLRSDWLTVASAATRPIVKTVGRDGVIVGQISYVKKRYVRSSLARRLPFLTYNGNPSWTPYGGIVLDRTLSAADQKQIARDLIRKLPRFSSFKFQLASHTPDADIIKEAFAEAGFKITGNRTRVMRPVDPGIFVPAHQSSNLDAVHDAFLSVPAKKTPEPLDILAILGPDVSPKNAKDAGRARAQVRNAAEELEIVHDISPKQFTEMYEENLRRDGKESREPLPDLERLIAHGIETGCVRILGARHKDGGPIDAAIACAWDGERYYLWRMTVRKSAESESEEQKPHPHASKLLTILAAIDARRKNLLFDSEGGSEGQTEKLYPRLRIEGEEVRPVAARYGPVMLAAEFTRAGKKAWSALWSVPKRPSQPDATPTAMALLKDHSI